jgi:23S rRNA (uracil1939-C5)-methyltransferase
LGIKKRDICELDIIDMAFGGRGIAKVDGFTIFVDKTAPMDRVRARIYRKKKNFAEAGIVELMSPSPFRIDPPCRYSGFCGGCKWQFLDYNKQLEYKKRHVSESIEHIGQVSCMTVHETIPSKNIFGYRNKMEFSCSDRRWLLPEEMEKEDIDTGFAIGLHVPGTFYKVLDTQACLLQPEVGNMILNDVREYMKNSKAPAYGLRSHEGFWRFLMVRHSVFYDQWMVNIITAAEDRNIVQPLADYLAEKYPDIVSIVNNITSSKAGIAIGEKEVLLRGEPVIKDRIGKYEFEISANSFFQTNTSQAEQLYTKIKEYAELKGDETVIDLYSGTGTIPIWLADSAKSVTGFEVVETAVADAMKNSKNNGIDNVSFVKGDIRESLGRATQKPDVMIIDPPRAGMHKDVVKQVLAMAPEKIVYVSCNPATLARDIALLKDDYELLEVQPVDMFPHTFHIEAVAKLSRKAKK